MAAKPCASGVNAIPVTSAAAYCATLSNDLLLNTLMFWPAEATYVPLWSKVTKLTPVALRVATAPPAPCENTLSDSAVTSNASIGTETARKTLYEKAQKRQAACQRSLICGTCSHLRLRQLPEVEHRCNATAPVKSVTQIQRGEGKTHAAAME
jgi:hypothetical protein